MPDGPGDAIVLCADPSPERLSELTQGLRREGFSVLSAHSASQCLAIAAAHRPKAVILDVDLLYLDYENLAEYINYTSPATVVVVTVDDLPFWQNRPPFVQAVGKRGNVAAILSLLHRISSP